MPHPQGNFKRSGDTHPPDVEWEPADEERVAMRKPRRAAEIETPVTILASKRMSTPFWKTGNGTMARIGMVAMAGVMLHLLLGRRTR